MAKLHYIPYIQNQTVLFPQRIDEDIAENDPVRRHYKIFCVNVKYRIQN